MAIKTFTAGEVLTASDTNTYLNNGGLVYITSTTIGSAVSSVTVSNVFSSTYDSYRIVASNITASTETNTRFQFGPSSVSGYNTSYGGALIYTTWAAGGYLDARDNGATLFSYVANTQANAGSFAFDVNNPYNAKYATIGPCGWNSGGGSGVYNGIHQQNQSYTAFTISPSSGTWTGGTVVVYGYRKA